MFEVYPYKNRMLKLFLAGATVATALPFDFLSTFYSSTTCNSGIDDTISTVLAPQQLCHATGDGQSYAGELQNIRLRLGRYKK